MTGWEHYQLTLNTPQQCWNKVKQKIKNYKICLDKIIKYVNRFGTIINLIIISYSTLKFIFDKRKYSYHSLVGVTGGGTFSLGWRTPIVKLALDPRLSNSPFVLTRTISFFFIVSHLRWLLWIMLVRKPETHLKHT